MADTGTDFFVNAGGATGGGAALGALAGFFGWSVRMSVVAFVDRLRKRQTRDVSMEGLLAFQAVGVPLGSLAGFLTWLYEH